MTEVVAQSWSLSWPTDPSVVAFAIAILATGYVYLKARRKSRRDPLAGPPPFSSLAAQRRIETQMTELLVELEKMARQMNAQLETRAAKLEELIRQADERIARLEMRQREALAGRERLPAERSTAVGSENVGCRLSADGQGDVGPSPTGEGASGAALEEDVPRTIPIDPRHAEICRLADEGRNIQEIAREVRQPAGEVELILKLCRRAR